MALAAASATVPLASGAEGRWTNAPSPLAVVLVNGGRAAEVPGTWSASLEWLVGRLAPPHPRLSFLEVRYRVRSWRRLDACAEDARAALEAACERGAERLALVGFSMGGAVATTVAAHPAVELVVGVAPWLPERLDLRPLRGRRLVAVHGALDRALPGVPGVHPGLSRRAVERAHALGIDAEHMLVRGAGHAVALRAPWGVQPLPRAGLVAALAGRELARLER
jgi:dienelactone hydrolase